MKKKQWLRALLGLLLAVLLAFGALLGAVLYGAYDHIQGDPQIMVILGCQINPWGPSVLLQDRLDKALDYLEDHPDMTVVVSGGQGPDEHISEAQCMYDYLTEHGAKVILMSHLGKIDHKDPEKCEAGKKKNDMAPVAARLQELVSGKVTFVPVTRGEELENAIHMDITIED